MSIPIPITAWTALVLGFLYVFLTLNVVLERRSKKIVLGDNNDRITLKKIRGHANAAEQIPIALILLGLVEYLQGASYVIIIALILILGRLMHAAYFSFHGLHWRLRFWGMLLTVIAQLLALIALFQTLIM